MHHVIVGGRGIMQSTSEKNTGICTHLYYLRLWVGFGQGQHSTMKIEEVKACVKLQLHNRHECDCSYTTSVHAEMSVL